MALSIASTRLRHGSIRDAAALLESYEWNPRGRAAYDGSVLIAVQDLNRATSSLKGRDKVQVTCSQLFTGKSTGGRNFCYALEAQRDAYLSGHEPPELQLPFTQTLPTAEIPVVDILSSSQVLDTG